MSSDVEVLVLAAGFGKRLRPLTESLPKPLIEIGSKPIISYNLDLIKAAGFKRVFVNLHYLGEKIKSYLYENNIWDFEFVFLEEDPILDTGGTIKRVLEEFKLKNLLTINSDILLDKNFDLNQLIQGFFNQPKENIATLLLRQDENAASYGSLGVNKQGRVCSFLGKDYIKSEDELKYLMYTGVQILNSKILEYAPKDRDIFSITQDLYVQAMICQAYISSVEYSAYWNDIGTLDRLEQGRKYIG